MTGDFWSDLSDFFSELFVPGDDYFTGKFNEVLTSLSEKTNFDIELFKTLLKVDANGLEPVSYDFNGKTYVFTDFKFLNDNIDFIRSALSFILYFGLYYFNYRSFLYVIRGSTFVGGISHK